MGAQAASNRAVECRAPSCSSAARAHYPPVLRLMQLCGEFSERPDAPYNPVMTAQTEMPGPGSTLELDAPAGHEVVRRATQLCLRAEPHTGQSPCPAHVSEANRQLFGPIV